jgi:hypothetical protein
MTAAQLQRLMYRGGRMGATVLIVEDETVLAVDLAESLKDYGYDIVGIVGSGEEAVETALELDASTYCWRTSVSKERWTVLKPLRMYMRPYRYSGHLSHVIHGFDLFGASQAHGALRVSRQAGGR